MNPVEEKYRDLGDPGSWIGVPLHDVRPTPDGVGLYQSYQDSGGWVNSVHWHPDHGAHETHGKIRETWGRFDWENGFLGYPVTDEEEHHHEGRRVGRRSRFEGGAIIWIEQTDTCVAFRFAPDGRWEMVYRERPLHEVAWELTKEHGPRAGKVLVLSSLGGEEVSSVLVALGDLADLASGS